MSNPQVVVRRDPEDLALATADWIVEASQKAIRDRGRFLIALSGGSTPEKAYLNLSDPTARDRIDWSKVFAFFGDERFVPPDDPRSNFAMAARTLLMRVPIPFGNVFPIVTQTSSADEAAKAYSKRLAGFFGLAETAPPTAMDLILLGLGDDGHTASLFPGKPAVLVKDSWFAGTPPGVLPPPVDRITATLPFLNAAREVLYLAAGEKKAPILRDVLESDLASARYPAAMVRPQNGTVTWLIDQAAASKLTLPH